METERLLAQLLCQFQDTPGGLLPLLQAVQEDLGYIPPESIPGIAEIMNLSAAEVHGVISFYHDLKTAPVGRHTLQVCAAESCQAAGGRALEAAAQEALAIEFGETTAVPEPGTLLLLLMGAAGILLTQGRRRQYQAF